MITLVLFTVASIVIGILIAKRSDVYLEKAWYGLFGLTIGLGLGAIAAITIGEITPTTEFALANETDLVALGDARNIESGHFFLGCGNIEGGFYYFFYKKDAEGEIRFGKIRAGDNVSIVEEQRTGGVIKQYRRKNKYPGWGIRCDRDSRDVKYKIHIPTGSITNEFRLDLK